MSGWTADDLARLGKQRAGQIRKSRIYAKSSRHTFHKSGEMNKTEELYAAHLERLKQRSVIADYRFENVKLRLANKTFYTPDFMVIKPDGTLEMHEVKGYWEDDARVKIKVAAGEFPFVFVAVKRNTSMGDCWEKEYFHGEE